MPAGRPAVPGDGRDRAAITPGGFGTTAGPELRLDGLELVAGDGGCRLTGRFGDLADIWGSRSERQRWLSRWQRRAAG